MRRRDPKITCVECGGPVYHRDLCKAHYHQWAYQRQRRRPSRQAEEREVAEHHPAMIAKYLPHELPAALKRTALVGLLGLMLALLGCGGPVSVLNPFLTARRDHPGPASGIADYVPVAEPPASDPARGIYLDDAGAIMYNLLLNDAIDEG
jgi:hypothetical protein